MNRVQVQRFLFRLLLSIVCISGGYTQHCTVRKTLVDGQVTIATLLRLHKASGGGGKCGQISRTDFQTLEAIRWAVSKLNGDNSNSSFIPGIQIGLSVDDTCGSSLLASSSALSLLRDSRLDDTCNTAAQLKLLGILGPTESHTALAVADVIRQSSAPLPQVALSATPSSLINTTQYPNFFQAISSQADIKVLVEIVKQLGWNYITAVYTDDEYGKEEEKEFRRLANQQGICVTNSKGIPVDTASSNMAPSFLNDLLLNRSQPMGVVCLGSPTGIQTMLQEITKMVKTDTKYRHLMWILPAGFATSLDVSLLSSLQHNVIVVSPPREAVDDIQSSFLRILEDVQNNKDNTYNMTSWAEEYFMSTYKCRLPFSTKGNQSYYAGYNACAMSIDGINETSHQHEYVSAALDGVAVFAAALKSAHTDLCSGPGVCMQLLKATMTEYISKTNITASDFQSIFPTGRFINRRVQFDSNGNRIQEPGEILYIIHNLVNGNFRKVGHYQGADVHMNLSSVSMVDANGNTLSGDKLPMSICRGICAECLANQNTAFAYIPGQMLLIGLFTVGKASSDPYICMDDHAVDSNKGFYSMEAFLHAVGVANVGRSGPSIGGVALDYCGSAVRAIKMVSDILSGQMKLVDGDTGLGINTTRVVGFIGDLSSTTTMGVESLLTPLQRPLVNNGATSILLDDRNQYPLFVRTVSSDANLITAMLDIVKSFNTTYINVVTSGDIHGQRSLQYINSQISSLGICMSYSLNITATATPLSLRSDVESLVKASLTTRILLFLGNARDVQNLLLTLNLIYTTPGNKYSNTPRLFLIGGESMGEIDSVLGQFTNNPIAGALVLRTRVLPNVAENFGDYLKTKSPSKHQQNPWLKRYWQDHFKCNLPGSFYNRYGQTCVENLHMSLDKESIVGLTSGHVITSVLATTQGMDQTSIAKCGGTTNEDKLFECLSAHAQDLLSAITDAKLLDGSVSTRIFDNMGNSVVDFQIWNLQFQKSSQKMKSILIGSYTSKKGLSLNSSKVHMYEGNSKLIGVGSICSPGQPCAGCRRDTTAAPPMTTPIPVTTTATPWSGFFLPVIIAFAALLGLLIIVICCMAGVICVIRSRRDSPKKAVRDKARANASHRDLEVVRLKLPADQKVLWERLPDGSPTAIIESPRRRRGSLPDAFEDRAKRQSQASSTGFTTDEELDSPYKSRTLPVRNPKVRSPIPDFEVGQSPRARAESSESRSRTGKHGGTPARPESPNLSTFKPPSRRRRGRASEPYQSQTLPTRHRSTGKEFPFAPPTPIADGYRPDDFITITNDRNPNGGNRHKSDGRYFDFERDAGMAVPDRWQNGPETFAHSINSTPRQRSQPDDFHSRRSQPTRMPDQQRPIRNGEPPRSNTLPHRHPGYSVPKSPHGPLMDSQNIDAVPPVAHRPNNHFGYSVPRNNAPINLTGLPEGQQNSAFQPVGTGRAEHEDDDSFPPPPSPRTLRGSKASTAPPLAPKLYPRMNRPEAGMNPHQGGQPSGPSQGHHPRGQPGQYGGDEGRPRSGSAPKMPRPPSDVKSPPPYPGRGAKQFPTNKPYQPPPSYPYSSRGLQRQSNVTDDPRLSPRVTEDVDIDIKGVPPAPSLSVSNDNEPADIFSELHSHFKNKRSPQNNTFDDKNNNIHNLSKRVSPSDKLLNNVLWQHSLGREKKSAPFSTFRPSEDSPQPNGNVQSRTLPRTKQELEMARSKTPDAVYLPNMPCSDV